MNLIKDKRGVTPRQWIIMIVSIGLLFAASAYWINAWEGKYNQMEGSNLSDSYNSISEMAELTETMSTNIQPESKSITSIGFLDFIVSGAYNALIAVLKAPNILKNYAYEAAGSFGIPRVYVDGLVILIAVGAIFGVISAVFRRKV